MGAWTDIEGGGHFKDGPGFREAVGKLELLLGELADPEECDGDDGEVRWDIAVNDELTYSAIDEIDDHLLALSAFAVEAIMFRTRVEEHGDEWNELWIGPVDLIAHANLQRFITAAREAVLAIPNPSRRAFLQDMLQEAPDG